MLDINGAGWRELKLIFHLYPLIKRKSNLAGRFYERHKRSRIARSAQAFDYIAESLTAKIYRNGGWDSFSRADKRVDSVHYVFTRSLARSIGGDLQLVRTVIMRQWRRTVGANKLTNFPEKAVDETIIVRPASRARKFGVLRRR